MIPILSILGHILYASKSPPPCPIGHITTLQPLAIARNIAMQSVATATHIVILLQGHLKEESEHGDDWFTDEEFGDSKCNNETMEEGSESEDNTVDSGEDGSSPITVA